LILPWLLGWEPMGLSFDLILHSGTLLAVLIYFRRDLFRLAYELWETTRGKSSGDPSLLLPLLVGSVPAAVAGFLGGDLVEFHLRTPWVVVGTLAGVGVLLLWVDGKGEGNRRLDRMGWQQGLVIGLAQALALVPGVSRSGITIVAALWLGYSRFDSARFSFLLAIPVIGGATTVKILELAVSGPSEELALVPLLLGVVFSFASGFLCVKYFLRYVQVRSFLPFAVYRLCLSGFICWWLLA
jgi:undecaprenyl-diphosphatase